MTAAAIGSSLQAEKLAHLVQSQCGKTKYGERPHVKITHVFISTVGLSLSAVNHNFTSVIVSKTQLWKSNILKCLPLSTCISPFTLLLLLLSSSHLCISLRAIMVSHKEFVGAGKQPGLQVWRIENLDLKPVPKALHGNFFTGDAYLLLYTTSAPSYNIHMWLGKT